MDDDDEHNDDGIRPGRLDPVSPILKPPSPASKPVVDSSLQNLNRLWRVDHFFERASTSRLSHQMIFCREPFRLELRRSRMETCGVETQRGGFALFVHFEGKDVFALRGKSTVYTFDPPSNSPHVFKRTCASPFTKLSQHKILLP